MENVAVEGWRERHRTIEDLEVKNAKNNKKISQLGKNIQVVQIQ